MTCAKGKKLKQWHGPHFLMMNKNDLKLHVTTVTEAASEEVVVTTLVLVWYYDYDSGRA